MAKLIKGGTLVANEWETLTLAAGADPATAKVLPGNVLVPLAVWQARRWDLVQRQWEHGNRLGVWLAPTDDLEALAPHLEDLDVIGVHFPAVADGRGYSIATLLRTRYRYRGEVRAIGAVERDYLHFLARAGFDAFEVADPEDAIGSLNVFTVAYQPPVPGASLALAV